MNEGKNNKLIEHIYDAAIEENLWPDVLTEISDSISADYARIISISGVNSSQYSIIHNNFDRANELNKKFVEEYLYVDTIATRPFHTPVDYALRDTDFISESDINSSSYFQEFLRGNDMSPGMHLRLDLVRGQTTLVQFRRRVRARKFGDRNVHALQALAPHLQRSLKWQHLLKSSTALAGMGFEITDRLGYGVVVLGPARNVSFANDTARHIAARDDGFILASRSVGAMNPGDNTILQAMIRDSFGLPDAADGPKRASVLLHRSSEMRPYEVLVAPWMENQGQASLRNTGHTIIFIRDPDRRIFASPEILRELFDLTPSEARLASALAADTTVADYAREHNLSEETVRWHLKQIRLKTHTNRLSGLTNLIFSGVSVITR